MSKDISAMYTKEENKCIMPDCPYCPACEYGLVVYKDEDYDGYEQPTECKWICTRGENMVCQDRREIEVYYE